MRVNGYGASNFAFVAAATRPAATNPAPKSAFPASTNTVFAPERSIVAARSTAALAGNGALGKAGIAPITPPSLHAASAATISVAICPGGVRAAITASSASRPTSEATRDVRSHFETGFAIP